MTSNRRKIIKKHVNKKLLFRIRIFVLVFFLMIGITSFDIFQGTIDFLLALGGLLIGLTVGFLAGRMFDIRWHEDSKQIIGKMDKFGVVVLVLYMAFSVFRRQFFGQFIHGPTLTAFTFSLTSGIMLGRVISNVRSIRKILTFKDII